MKDYMRRYSLYLKYCQDLNFVPGDEHKYKHLVIPSMFNLDWGLLYLHLNAFVPAIELLGSDS